MPSRRNFSGTDTPRGGTRKPSSTASSRRRRRWARRLRGRTGRRCCGRPRPSASRSGRRAASRSSRRSRRYFWYTERCASSMTTRSKWPGPNRRRAVVASRRSGPSSSGRSRRRPGPSVSFSVTRFTGADIRQVRLERVDRLVHQRDAVGQEQHALDPVGAHQQVDQRDHRAGLARRRWPSPAAPCAAGRPRSASPIAPDRARLVVALDDRRVDHRRRPAACGLCAAGSAAPARPWCRSPAPRAAGSCSVVPQPVLVAVGVEDHRPLAEHLPPGSRRTAWPAAARSAASFGVRLASTTASGMPSSPHST